MSAADVEGGGVASSVTGTGLEAPSWESPSPQATCSEGRKRWLRRWMMGCEPHLHAHRLLGTEAAPGSPELFLPPLHEGRGPAAPPSLGPAVTEARHWEHKVRQALPTCGASVLMSCIFLSVPQLRLLGPGSWGSRVTVAVGGSEWPGWTLGPPSLAPPPERNGIRGQPECEL